MTYFEFVVLGPYRYRSPIEEKMLPVQDLLSQKSVQALIAVLLVTGPCCGFFVVTSLQERARVEAIPPAELPGHVLVYSAPS